MQNLWPRTLPFASTACAVALACALDGPVVVHETRILSAPDAAPGDIYGGAVGLSGDWAFVASEWDDDDGKDSGAVWVFHRKDGQWTREQKLRAPDAAAGDNFGRSIAVDGDVAVIGAHWDDSPRGENAGSAYVWRRDGGRWKVEQKLQASDGGTWNAMGNAVSIEGDLAAVAAWRHGAVGPESGAVYLFHRAKGRWRQVQKLVPHDAAAKDQFGRGVWISGDAIVVGAWHDDDRGENSGAAYVFRRKDGRFVEEQKLVPRDAAAGDQFGFSVSMDGDVAVVGAHQKSVGVPKAGAAYVFRHDGEQWREEQRLVAADPRPGAWLGWAVAISGDRVLASSHFAFDRKDPHPGFACLFEREDGAWKQTRTLVPSDGHPGDTFSFHLALDGTTGVLGAWRNKHAGVNSGQGYVFEGL